MLNRFITKCTLPITHRESVMNFLIFPAMPEENISENKSKQTLYIK